MESQVDKKRKHSETEVAEEQAEDTAAATAADGCLDESAAVVGTNENEKKEQGVAGEGKNADDNADAKLAGYQQLHRHGSIAWRADAGEGGGPNSSCVRAGDLVVIYERHDRMKQHRVVPGGQLNNRYGNFDHDDWIDKLEFGSIAYAKPFKSQLQSSEDDLSKKKGRGKGAAKRGFVYVLRPTCELWSLVLPHRTQILYVADISMVVMQLKLRPGSMVMECGTGSGSLTHALYRAVAPTGKVYTYEYHELRANQAKEEFERHGIDLKEEDKERTGGIHTEQRDIMELGFPTEGTFSESADAVFLDLPGPWKVIPSVAKCLKVGGTVCTFSPCIEQVQKTLEAMAKENVFYRMRTMEILLRPYEIKQEKVVPFPEKEEKRPKQQKGKKPWGPRMQSAEDSEFFRKFAIPAPEIRGHTSYLTFAQKVTYAK